MNSPLLADKTKAIAQGDVITKMNTLTEEFIANVCDLIAAGNYESAAAMYHGVSPNQFFVWLRLGKKIVETGGDDPRGRPLYAQLYRRVARAREYAQVTLTAKMRDLAMGAHAVYDAEGRLLNPGTPPDFRAIKWLLERRWPELWGEAPPQQTAAERAQVRIMSATADKLEKSASTAQALSPPKPSEDVIEAEVLPVTGAAPKAMGLEDTADIKALGAEIAQRITERRRAQGRSAPTPAPVRREDTEEALADVDESAQ